jgi:hypothetical protein
MKLAGWVLAAFLGFALAATFMDAPARWLTAVSSAPRAGEVAAEAGLDGRSLAARTRALEEFADRCATEQWDQAEELRDAAGRSELQGDRSSAEDFDAQATALYEDAREEAVLRRQEGRCLDQSTYEEMPQPNPRDPGKIEPSEGLPSPDGSPFEVGPPLEDRSARPEPEPRYEPEPDPGLDAALQDAAEAGLRSRAALMAARGDPCGAARLLREQGGSQRTLLLARELMDRCRSRRGR